MTAPKTCWLLSCALASISARKLWASAGEDVSHALLNMRSFVRAAGLWYGIYHDAVIDQAFCDRVRQTVEVAYEGVAL